MSLHKNAGKTAPKEILENIALLVSDYYTRTPNLSNKEQLISFGTSGHRGSSSKNSFNEKHIMAMAQAVAEYHKKQGHEKLFLGMDTHALSTPAHKTTLEVLAGNKIQTFYAKNFSYTPTPVISHAILTNKNSDGIVITPSHNPPSDGGFKYNSCDGGPANEETTKIIEQRANEILMNDLEDVNIIDLEDAIKSGFIHEYDYVTPYVNDLENIIDIKAIKESKLKIAADAMGGSGIEYYKAIKEKYDLDMQIFNDYVDFTFSFMTCDKDGKIRMDCSSSFAMASLIKLKDDFDIAFGNDTDFDRHGIITKSSGLLNPNHYLAVAIDYLAKNRDFSDLAIGKTLVSSSMIDKVAEDNNIKVIETPVGFKWFVEPLVKKKIFFAGEESAGASFLRKNKEVWTTDKDGIILNLLAAEILAKTKLDPGEYYDKLVLKYGNPVYERIDAPANSEQKKVLKNLKPEDIKQEVLAGEKIEQILTIATNGAKIGGLKVLSKNGWFAIRPSGTEDIYKIYAESFIDKNHLKLIQGDAKKIASEVFK
ncbi:alpha-D-glucose phosphate-specific phosphoglucomutase [Halarcobacter mediterraneus]|uniref:Alpha-D-glucose phosphate-specific phosphoglucomutase n=1 Tax=Halarcobacter mediterraneus TaxID=2023153 RepID=A0A4Q1B586_9BACT|nr:alpha-D-glucose phosphate-specific phosphoglucomutase [Halarcobacter mediterraneus]RXK13447.1 alpha-D-glucose phosphate-specific phosphoglucomutase [Halarcobacter mediterraneus]